MSELEYKPDRSDVQGYLRILQDVVIRMASNSRFCKAWCITLVSAILVFVARTDITPVHMWIAAIPIAAFLFLDAYYLSLERRFRKTYERIVARVHEETLAVTHLYLIRPTGSSGRVFIRCLISPAIWLFYGMLLGMLLLMWHLLGLDRQCS